MSWEFSVIWINDPEPEEVKLPNTSQTNLSCDPPEGSWPPGWESLFYHDNLSIFGVEDVNLVNWEILVCIFHSFFKDSIDQISNWLIDH